MDLFKKALMLTGKLQRVIRVRFFSSFFDPYPKTNFSNTRDPIFCSFLNYRVLCIYRSQLYKGNHRPYEAPRSSLSSTSGKPCHSSRFLRSVRAIKTKRRECYQSSGKEKSSPLNICFRKDHSPLIVDTLYLTSHEDS